MNHYRFSLRSWDSRTTTICRSSIKSEIYFIFNWKKKHILYIYFKLHHWVDMSTLVLKLKKRKKKDWKLFVFWTVFFVFQNFDDKLNTNHRNNQNDWKELMEINWKFNIYWYYSLETHQFKIILHFYSFFLIADKKIMCIV